MKVCQINLDHFDHHCCEIETNKLIINSESLARNPMAKAFGRRHVFLVCHQKLEDDLCYKKQIYEALKNFEVNNTIDSGESTLLCLILKRKIIFNLTGLSFKPNSWPPKTFTLKLAFKEKNVYFWYLRALSLWGFSHLYLT